MIATQYRDAAPFMTALGRLLRLRTRERAWRIGAAGEIATARALRPLLRPWWAPIVGHEQRWFVLHSVPVGRGSTDIDHVLIGPPGVFVINAKHHPGATVWCGDHAITVNRAASSYARKAVAEAERAARLLSAAADGQPVPVRPIVAVVGAMVTGRKTTRDGVLVVPARRLPRVLRRGQRLLTDDQIRDLYAIARRSTTWIQ